eukprot:TRINITY_DN17583_c0_g1_i1.p1 TRINITY_DN17583_c0_g1~~TRINITY_DN17583_c0_g1_i1.p1  ORF type:complete len:197 (+),score=17.58 TRINITY_DN17583_c0_g1_i1:42-632(+)
MAVEDVWRVEDGLNLGLGLITHLPFVLVLGLISLIVINREVHWIFFFFGQILNLAFNSLLKNIIRQPRPTKSTSLDYGMPSSHSSYVFFFCAYLTCFVILKTKYTPTTRSFVIAVLAFIAIIVGYSRIHLAFHTLEQVIVGMILGIITGTSWYFFVQNYLLPVYSPWLQKTRFKSYLVFEKTVNEAKKKVKKARKD